MFRIRYRTKVFYCNFVDINSYQSGEEGEDYLLEIFCKQTVELHVQGRTISIKVYEEKVFKDAIKEDKDTFMISLKRQFLDTLWLTKSLDVNAEFEYALKNFDAFVGKNKLKGDK